MSKTNTEHVKRMMECAMGNPDFFNDLKKICSEFVEARGGKAKVTLKQAELIDVEVSLLAEEIMSE